MENRNENDTTPLSDGGAGQAGLAKPWVKHLLAGQGFSLPEKVQFWWSVHLEAFLRYVRKRGPEIPLEQLVTDYLHRIAAGAPDRSRVARGADSSWRWRYFVRGIEQWRWETDTQGRPTPRFRLKCSVEAMPVAGDSRITALQRRSIAGDAVIGRNRGAAADHVFPRPS